MEPTTPRRTRRRDTRLAHGGYAGRKSLWLVVDWRDGTTLHGPAPGKECVAWRRRELAD